MYDPLCAITGLQVMEQAQKEGGSPARERRKRALAADSKKAKGTKEDENSVVAGIGSTADETVEEVFPRELMQEGLC